MVNRSSYIASPPNYQVLPSGYTSASKPSTHLSSTYNMKSAHCWILTNVLQLLRPSPIYPPPNYQYSLAVVLQLLRPPPNYYQVLIIKYSMYEISSLLNLSFKFLCLIFFNFIFPYYKGILMFYLFFVFNFTKSNWWNFFRLNLLNFISQFYKGILSDLCQ